MQVLVGLNLLPERSLTSFALVIFLRSAAGNQLHALSDERRTPCR